MSEQRKLTIEATYCKDWTIQDAIREIVQNAIDTRTEVDIVENGGYWEVQDKGCGIKLSDFLIGRSTKMDDDEAIGQFGEGLKIGCLVLARNGRQITVRANGKQFRFSFQYDKEWDSQLLTIDIEDSLRATLGSGTAVAIQCTREEIEEARALFLKFNPKPTVDKLSGRGIKAEILDDAGKIYVNGLKVTEVDALFGYNLHHKDLVNRDRSAIGFSAVKRCIGDTLSGTGNLSVIRKILRAAVDKVKNHTSEAAVEYNVNFSPRKMMWKRAITEMFGVKVCLSSNNPETNLRALEKHWYVLELPYDLAYSLHWILPNATDVIKDRKRIIPFNRLTADEKKFFLKAKGFADEIAGEVGLNIYPLKIFVDKDNKEELGYYQNGIAGICYETIQNQDLSGAMRTIIHEYTHGTSRQSDNSRGFENALGDIIASLALKLIAEKRNGMKKWTIVDLKKAQSVGA